MLLIAASYGLGDKIDNGDGYEDGAARDVSVGIGYTTDSS